MKTPESTLKQIFLMYFKHELEIEQDQSNFEIEGNRATLKNDYSVELTPMSFFRDDYVFSAEIITHAKVENYGDNIDEQKTSGFSNIEHEVISTYCEGIEITAEELENFLNNK